MTICKQYYSNIFEVYKHSLRANCWVVNVRASVRACVWASLCKYTRTLVVLSRAVFISPLQMLLQMVYNSLYYFRYRIEEISNNLYFQTARRKRSNLESESREGRKRELGKRMA